MTERNDSTLEVPEDQFRGDNDGLKASIKALLSLDEKGALVPHGVGGLARSMLASAYHRLPATDISAETLAAGAIVDIMTGGSFDWRSRLDDSDFLESADWACALAYARAARRICPSPPSIGLKLYAESVLNHDRCKGRGDDEFHITRLDGTGVTYGDIRSLARS